MRSVICNFCSLFSPAYPVDFCGKGRIHNFMFVIDQYFGGGQVRAFISRAGKEGATDRGWWEKKGDLGSRLMCDWKRGTCCDVLQQRVDHFFN